MNSAIIVAAGSGKRMGLPTPKQFIELAGKSILEHSIIALQQANVFEELIIVLSSDYLDYGTQLRNKYDNLKICEGGIQRFHSVQNALSILDPSCKHVFIHDAVRPFVSVDIIHNCLAVCQEKESAIPSILPKDSIRVINAASSKSVERSNYRMIQTPQAFETRQLKKAYEQTYAPHFTDDASVYENVGYDIHLVEGSNSNFKITTPEDLDLAKWQLSKQA